MDKFKIKIDHIPDKDELVVDIFYEDVCFAGLFFENEELRIEFYRFEEIEIWKFNYEELMSVLEEAKNKLLEFYPNKNLQTSNSLLKTLKEKMRKKLIVKVASTVNDNELRSDIAEKIFYKGFNFVEVFSEDGEFMIEFYRYEGKKNWKFDYQKIMNALEDAKNKLLEFFPHKNPAIKDFSWNSYKEGEMEKFEITIADVPHRDELIAEIVYKNFHFAEIFFEGEELRIEFYRYKEIEIWKFNYEELMNTIKKAKNRLLEMYPEKVSQINNSFDKISKDEKREKLIIKIASALNDNEARSEKVGQIFYRDFKFIEVIFYNKELMIEFYRYKGKDFWEFNYQEIMNTIEETKNRLLEFYPEKK